MHADASSITLGEVFAHLGEEFVDRLIAFDSIKLSTTDMNYMTTEREGVFMVYSLQKFQHYLLVVIFRCLQIILT